MILFRYLLVFISFFLLSCFQQRPSRLSQSLEGTIVSLSDVFRLKCVLKTGESLNKKVNWTEAEDIILEEKTKDGKYKSIEKSSVAFNGFDEDGEKTKNYINDFSYVSINSIEDNSSSTFLASTEEKGGAKIIQKGKLRCANLLSPEQHSFIIAKAHHSYDLEFQVIGNYLRALIVASPEDIPFQALPYSLKMGENRYGMPIGGYDIGLGYLEEVVNSDFEATRLLTFREVPIKNKEGQEEKLVNNIPTIYPQGVKEIQVRGEFKPFKTLLESGAKKDVYPKELFAGDWYYESTIVAASISQSVINNYNFSSDHERQPSNKIKIIFKDKHLIAYSLNIEEDLPSSSNLRKDRFVFKIPIEHVSYEASPSLSGQIVNAGLKEVLNEREDDADKDFVKVNFSQINSSELKFYNNYFGWTSFSLSVLNLSEDYISFVLHDEEQGTEIRYAFLRPKTNSTYTPLNVSQKSYNLFPAFFSKKRVHDNVKRIGSKKFENSYLVQRFNTNKPIIYRFSNVTPDFKYVRDIGRESINLWNQIFQKAGVVCPQKNCFLLDESEDVNLGDIRYNILHIANPKDLNTRSQMLGYGPSVVDLETGEIVSAVANLNLNLKYNNVIALINNYIMSTHGLDPSYRRALRLGHSRSHGIEFLKKQVFSGKLRKLFIPNYVFGIDKPGYDFVYGLNTDISSINDSESVKFITSIDEIITTEEDRSLLSAKYRMITGKEPSSSLNNEEMYKEITNSKQKGIGSHNCLLNSSDLTSGLEEFKLVGLLCEKELKDLMGTLYSSQSPHQKLESLWDETRKENIEAELHACAEKLLPIFSVNTLTHEMGHNVSMFHNFAGSSDKDNFLELKDFELKYVLSHLKDNEREMLLKEDVVQPASSTVMDYLTSVPLTPGRYDVDFVRFVYGGQLENKSTGKVVSVDPITLTNFDSNESLNTNDIRTYRVCNDYNLSQYLTNSDPFCQVWDLGTTATEILKDAYRRSEYRHSIVSFIETSIPFYHKWRLELSRILEGDDTYYLSSFDDPRAYRQIKEKICKDENHKLYDLCNATSFFVEKMEEVLFSSDHYCIVENGYTQQRDKISFRDIYREVREVEEFKSLRSSCQDFKNFLWLSGYKLIGEIGKPFFPMNFSTDKNYKPLYNFYDREGSYENRMYAALSFLIMTLDPVSYYDGGSRPISIMDEPDVRDSIHVKIKERLLGGDPSGGFYTYNFSNEKPLLKFASQIFLRHFNVTNSMEGIQSQIRNIVRVIPYSFFSRYTSPNLGTRININFLDFYANIRGSGGYILGEPLKVQSSGSEEPLVIRPIGSKQPLLSFISGIESISFRRSIIKLWNKTNDLNEEKNSTFFEKYKSFGSFLGKTIGYSTSLLSQEQVLNMATMVLLYDYFEKGSSKNLIVDHVVPFLQLAKFSLLRSKLGLEKDVDLEFSKNSSHYKDMIITAEQDQVRRLNPNHPNNPIKPNVDFFQDYFYKNPELLLKSSKEILDIYLLELFKSSEYGTTQVHMDLKALADKVIDNLNKNKMTIDVEAKEVEAGNVSNKKVTESEDDNLKETLVKLEDEIIDSSDELTSLVKKSAELSLRAVLLLKEVKKRSEKSSTDGLTSKGEANQLSPKDMINHFNDMKEKINHLKKLKNFIGNEFLREILVRNVFFRYRRGLNLDSRGSEQDLFRLLDSGSYLHVALAVLSILDSEVINARKFSEDKYHEHIKNLRELMDTFFNDTNIYNLSRYFQQNIYQSGGTFASNRMQSVFQYQGLMYFLTHNTIHRDDNHYLSRLVNNRLERETKAQEDILYNSLVPFLDIYNN